MSPKFLFLTVFFFFIFTSGAQINCTVKLVDQSDSPVKKAAVESGRKTFISDNEGLVTIPEYKKGNRIFIKRTGFADTVVAFKNFEINDSLTYVVKLRTKIFVLEEVQVYTNAVEEINPSKADFILDYELDGKNIVELLSGDELMIISDSLGNYRFPCVTGVKALVKDPYEKLTLVTPQFAQRINFENGSSVKMNVDSTKVAIDKFSRALTYCDALTDSVIYIRRYKNLNQAVAFYIYKDSAYTLLKEIRCEEKSQAVQAQADSTKRQLLYISQQFSENLAGEMGELNMRRRELRKRRDAQQAQWKMQMLYSKASYTVLKLINDSIYLFAHDLDSLFIYTKQGILVKSRPISYHHLKMWAGEIIINEEKSKAFAKMKTRSATLLAEIDLQSGEVKMPFFNIETKFIPRKIKVRNSSVYYMCKQDDGVGYTVYSQVMKNWDLKQDAFFDSTDLMKSRQYFAKALVEKGQQDYGKTLKYLDRSTDLNPDFAEAWLQKGIVYGKEGHSKKAIQCYTKAVEVKKNYSLAYYQRGMVKAALKQYKDALEDYENAIYYNGNNAGIYLAAGNCWMDLKKYDTAAYYFSHAAKMDITLWQATYKCGILNFRSGHIQEAIENFNTALIYNNSNKIIYLKRGMAYDELKEHNKAIDDFNTAISLDVAYIDAYIFKGNSLMELDEFNSARVEFDFVLKLQPANFTACYNRATCKYLLKNYKEAIADYSSSIQLKPSNQKAFYFRGMAELSLGRKNEACSDFKKAGTILDAQEKRKSFCN